MQVSLWLASSFTGACPPVVCPKPRHVSALPSATREGAVKRNGKSEPLLCGERIGANDEPETLDELAIAAGALAARAHVVVMAAQAVAISKRAGGVKQGTAEIAASFLSRGLDALANAWLDLRAKKGPPRADGDVTRLVAEWTERKKIAASDDETLWETGRE